MTSKDSQIHDDPLMQIQQAEEKVRHKLTKKEEDNRKKIEEEKEKAEKELKTAEEEARTRGNKKIEEAKITASNSLKIKLAAVDREVGALANKAEVAKKEAINLVVNSFEETLK